MERRKDIENLAHKALDQSDERLMNLFDDEELESESTSPGLIYQELKSIQQHFTDKEEINRGGMKLISRVFDQRTQRHLAMAELLHPNEVNDEAFLREARITAYLDHPNIISVYEMGLGEKEQPFFTMTLKQGDDLEQILSLREAGDLETQEKYSLEVLLDIFQKVCDAIDYAHSKSILHLDLKPSNIQVGHYGEVLVCDWGLSKILGQRESAQDPIQADLLNDMTLHGQIKGTPGYMAPEQITSGDKCPQTDVYALGSILFRITSGRPAFRGGIESILEHTKEGSHAPLELPLHPYAKGLEACIEKAMQTQIDQRYGSVEELLNDIRQIRLGFAAKAEEASLLRLTSLFLSRHKTIVGLSALSGLVILIGLITFIVEINRERTIAMQERDRAEKVSVELQREKNELQAMNDIYIEDLITQVDFISNNIHSWELNDKQLYEIIQKYTDRAVELNLAKDSIWKQKFMLYFITQKYRLAKELVHQFEGEEDLKQLSQTLAPQQGDDAHANLLTAIQNLGSMMPRAKYRGIIDRMISYHNSVHDLSIEQKLQITQALFAIWNKGLDGSFKFEPETQRLILSGKLKFFLRFERNVTGLRNSIFWLLEPRELKLQNTDFQNLEQFFDLPVKTLDLRDASVTSLEGIDAYEQLIVLKVKRGMYLKSQLKALPHPIKVVQN